MPIQTPASIAFGTSGLRGRAEGFTPEIVMAHVAGFLETACSGASGREVIVGYDLRASSPAIAGLVGGAVERLGWRAINAGPVPTPALALAGIERGGPGIMVTGSHIPADYNGLKFYRPDDELLKSDEEPIRLGARTLLEGGVAAFAPRLPQIDPRIGNNYEARYLTAFAPGALGGLRVGVFEHSAVGRDMLGRVLTALGAQCVRIGRSENFVAVDTEAVEPGVMEELRGALAEYRLDAIVSTDGDGDRPLLIDGAGEQINGDVLGALTARALGARTIVTPLTSTGALEMSGWFERIERTKIGSPYVVAAMAGAGENVAGFEANGGYLVGSQSGRLAPLPTRDAMVPLIAVLAEAVSRGVPVGDLAGDLPKRVMRADRLKDVAPEAGKRLVAELATSGDLRARFGDDLMEPATIDTTDGTRLVAKDGTIVHFRQSGNAPELRCYVETDSAKTTQAVLSMTMASLAAYFERT